MNILDYRAWDKEEKVMIEWSNTFFSDMSPVTGWGNEIDYDKVELMLYAGFTDDNGVKVYCGDIVIVYNTFIEMSKPYKAEVVWDKYRIAFEAIDKPDYRSIPPYMNADPFGLSINIIGNRYVNPELLEG